MTVHIRRVVLGVVAMFLGMGVAAPLAYWLICTSLDKAFGFGTLVAMPISLILAAASILVGVFWISWSYSYLVFVGKGLPFEAFGRALQPTRELVTTGPYAYTRNPMILGELFILLGVAFLAGSISGVCLVPIVTVLVYAYLVEFEEKALVRRFGADYEEYRRNVPSLVPRLSPYIHEPAAT